DLHVTAVDGVPATDPRSAEVVDIADALANVVPTMLINAKGTYAGTGDPEPMFARLRELFPRQAGKLKRMASSPGMRAVLDDAMASRWHAWVETWLGYDPKAGSPQTLAHEWGTTVLTRDDAPVAEGRRRLSAHMTSVPDYMHAFQTWFLDEKAAR